MIPGFWTLVTGRSSPVVKLLLRRDTGYSILDNECQTVQIFIEYRVSSIQHRASRDQKPVLKGEIRIA